MRIQINTKNEEIDVSEYKKRINKLKKNIRHNGFEIDHIVYNISEVDLNKIESHFSENLNLLRELEEYINESNDVSLKNSIAEVLSLYRSVQNSLLSKKMMLIDKKLEFLDYSIDGVKEKTDEITGNILFSTIAIFLGISLVTSMIAGIDKISREHLLVYYVTIGWLATTIIGISFLLLRNFNKKSTFILMVIGIFSFILLLVIWKTF